MTDTPPQQPARPRHAATVLLLREYAGQTQVLMIRRHEGLAFMGGLWVFHGGILATADASPAALAITPSDADRDCAQLHDLNGTALARRDCLALAVAACREAFEETGVLLATHAD